MRILSTSTCLLTIVISIASCDGKQSIQPSNNTTKNVAVMEQACDPVNDTIYLNFHSNMKQDDFDVELVTNPSIVDGKITLYSEDKTPVTFNVTPSFNECLTAIRLESQVQFGKSKSKDYEELEFYKYLKNELESIYGEFNLIADSSYSELLGRKTKIKQVPYWVQKYSYPHWALQMLLKAPEGKPIPFGPASRKSATVKNEVIEELTSASYKSYRNHNKGIEIILVKSNYNYSTNVSSHEVQTSTVYIQINYYSNRHLKLSRDRIIKNNEKSAKEILKSDSLFKANKHKL
jgi:hypothetical protein